MPLIMMGLADKRCLPCRGGVPPLDHAASTRLLAELSGWSIERGHHLSKSVRLENFIDALDFVNKVGALAEEQGHHPDIFLTWGLVRIEIWTHKIDGLTESDFILVAKIDKIAQPNS